MPLFAWILLIERVDGVGLKGRGVEHTIFAGSEGEGGGGGHGCRGRGGESRNKIGKW